MTKIDFDAVLAQIGERGRYQTRLYYLLCIPATLPAIFLSYNQVFVSATPEHWCKVPELDTNFTSEEVKLAAIPYTLKSDGSREYSSCTRYDMNFTSLLLSSLNITSQPDWNVTSCTSGWNYDKTYYENTLVTQLDLVCDKSWWVATSTTCYCIGSLFGNIVFGFIGDKLGRRPAFMLALFWHVLLSTATAFSNNYLTYTVLRSINALVFPAIYQVPFVIALEMMGPNHRTFAGMMLCVFFALALVVLAAVTFVLRDWFSLLIWTSTPFIALFSYYWLIPESPRWLLSKGRIDEAEIIVQKIAKVNGNPVQPDFLRTFQEEQSILQPVVDDEKEKVNVTALDMLKRPVLRRTFLIATYDWIANAIIYSGLTYNSANLGVRDQTAFMLGAAVELPSYLFAWWAMDRWGRRSVIVWTMLSGGIACLSCGVVPDSAVWVTVTLAMVGRFGVAASFAVFYTYIGEVLPTVVRSQSMALASFVANLGLLAFPSIVQLAVYNRVLPLLVFGALSLSGALASTLLPETLGLPLPQTLDDGEIMHAKSKERGIKSLLICCSQDKVTD